MCHDHKAVVGDRALEQKEQMDWICSQFHPRLKLFIQICFDILISTRTNVHC
jgi:hypothetical protein